MRLILDPVVSYCRESSSHLQRCYANFVPYGHRCQRVAIPAIGITYDAGSFGWQLDTGPRTEAHLFDHRVEIGLAYAKAGFYGADVTGMRERLGIIYTPDVM